MQTVTFQDLGEIDYKQAWDLQESLLAETVRQKVENRTLEPAQHFPPRHYLLFCEHPHVFTLGKSGAEEHLLADEQKLEEIGATYYKINRGGDITYHGPGQLVGYPIFDLDHFFNDIHKYLRLLEESIILTLAEYGIEAGRVSGLTGVWLDGDDKIKARKICAFGVRCSRWVTMHGFAFNINNDLSYFNKIVPCGIADKGVTSLSKELGREVNINEVKSRVLFHMQTLFEFEVVKEEISLL
ncbi:MAG: lipoyl(octanoyl) transferase LipB [Bacteroidia bacterium]|nr:lipoyl(octanoyl) transferase LipB [Bacteroidia bacterium]MBP7245769.1 lipoyl(octanoyl) transferase LipB [Bacteroidia bacterium]